jgi:hypothetical protein
MTYVFNRNLFNQGKNIGLLRFTLLLRVQALQPDKERGGGSVSGGGRLIIG